MATQTGQTLKSSLDIKEPDMYDVIMLNDDFTTMDFVVMVLKQIFFHNDTEAEMLMLDIHNKGKCIVGTYTLDIAQSKVSKTIAIARNAGFPLRLKISKKV